MNSEELELSLRTEFETYLKGVVAEMRQDVIEFQKNIESEFEKHKSNLDENFRTFSERLDSDRAFDEAFAGSVVEHLRLARDEGAKITANAFAEAEKMQAAAPSGSFANLRNAIDDISSQNSQASILRSLVDHATEFTARGAFFIVKNDKLVGWKVFGKEAFADDDTVRAVEFSLTSDTVLSDAVAGLSTRSAQFADASGDAIYLDPLGFAAPDTMFAVPLTARGRGVAVLYADAGIDGGSVDIEALESLVRVAGLTVELLASGQPAKANEAETVHETATADEYQPAEHLNGQIAETEEIPEVIYEDATPIEAEAAEEAVQEIEAEYAAEPTFEPTDYDETAQQITYAETPATEASPWSEPASGQFEPAEPVEQSTEFSFAENDVETADEVETTLETTELAAEPAADELVSEYVESAPYIEPESEDDSFGTVEFEETRLEEQVQTAPAEEPVVSNGSSAAHQPEPVVEIAGAQPARTRLSDRNVDLPIEVADDERRLHNDARRFARLLVSEIKLYNEQKVAEGREAADLYDRLREAIDRSREMYEKRVQPPVAAKFDYFHYELVNSLGDGDASRLGTTYPGANV